MSHPRNKTGDCSAEEIDFGYFSKSGSRLKELKCRKRNRKTIELKTINKLSGKPNRFPYFQVQ